jgi:hypothetical protein
MPDGLDDSYYNYSGHHTMIAPLSTIRTSYNMVGGSSNTYIIGYLSSTAGVTVPSTNPKTLATITDAYETIDISAYNPNRYSYALIDIDGTSTGNIWLRGTASTTDLYGKRWVGNKSWVVPLDANSCFSFKRSNTSDQPRIIGFLGSPAAPVVKSFYDTPIPLYFRPLTLT